MDKETAILALQQQVAALEAWREQMCWKLLAESVGGTES